MRNRIAIITISIIVGVLSVFYLTLSWVSRGVEKDADKFANEDYLRKQYYLDSIWDDKIYFGFSYGDIKTKELNLGLDLRGGMHVTLEIDDSEILKAISPLSDDTLFARALVLAKERKANNDGKFTTLFFSSLQEISPQVRFSEFFCIKRE